MDLASAWTAQPPGFALTARYFFLSCQEEVPKKKARPLRRPATPGALRCSFATGSCGTRAVGPQTVLALVPVAPCAVRRRKGQVGNRSDNNLQRYRFRSVCFASPLCSAEQRSAAGGSRRGLSEGRRPEFRSRPAVRVAQGSRQSRPRNAGVAFFLVTFSWRRKKKLHAVRAEYSTSSIPHSPPAQERVGRAQLAS